MNLQYTKTTANLKKQTKKNKKNLKILYILNILINKTLSQKINKIQTITINKIKLSMAEEVVETIKEIMIVDLQIIEV
jgi:hypothetical protein